jgi:hypothetical protein
MLPGGAAAAEEDLLKEGEGDSEGEEVGPGDLAQQRGRVRDNQGGLWGGVGASLVGAEDGTAGVEAALLQIEEFLPPSLSTEVWEGEREDQEGQEGQEGQDDEEDQGCQGEAEAQEEAAPAAAVVSR